MLNCTRMLEMQDKVQEMVFEALRKGREMRMAQKEYFRTRSQKALTESKQKEAAFDEALDDAAYAVKHGAPRPKQQEFL